MPFPARLQSYCRACARYALVKILSGFGGVEAGQLQERRTEEAYSCSDEQFSLVWYWCGCYTYLSSISSQRILKQKHWLTQVKEVRGSQRYNSLCSLYHSQMFFSILDSFVVVCLFPLLFPSPPIRCKFHKNRDLVSPFHVLASVSRVPGL